MKENDVITTDAGVKHEPLDQYPRFHHQKTASYYVTHISVAAMVAYAVTGNLLASVTLSLLEPTVQAVVYFFHERVWQSAAPAAAA